MRSLMWLLLLLHSISRATNADFEKAVNEAKLAGQSKKQDGYNQAKKFDPHAVFDYYTNHPQQSKYYQNETQSHVQQFTQDALLAKNADAGKTITTTINNHPQYVLKSSDPDSQHALLLQREAYNILHGITNQYIDCKPKQACTTQYDVKYCEASPQAIFQSCKKKLIVEVIAHETVTHYPLTTSLSVKDHHYAGVNVNAANGTIYFIGPHEARFNLAGRIPANIDCHSLLGSVISSSGDAKLDNIDFPSCSNELVLNYHFSGGKSKNLKLDIASKKVTYEMKDRWIDECPAINQDATCQLKSELCDIPKSTQVIQGLPVTRDCWQYSFNYICRFGEGKNNCDELHQHQCEQIGSVCKEKKNDQCISYHQTYRCARKSCSPTTDILCGNGKEYCLDGNCTDRTYEISQDFAKAASSLSGASGAAKNLDQSSVTIFAGHAAECSEKPVGFSNCCTESGWGQDTGLDHCPDLAKKLHVDREHKLAIKVSRYCSGPEPFPCIEHAQVFCVFSSKLAKILQEQGRRDQLHISFGRRDEPNCRGITPEELQKIDFAKIDFKDFIVDLNSKIKNPNVSQIQARIKQEIEAARKGRSNA